MIRKQPALKPIYDDIFFEGAKKIDSLVGKTLEELIEESKSYIMSDEEKEEQRRSFVYGNLKLSNPNITREMIDKIADELNKSKNGLHEIAEKLKNE